MGGAGCLFCEGFAALLSQLSEFVLVKLQGRRGGGVTPNLPHPQKHRGTGAVSSPFTSSQGSHSFESGRFTEEKQS